LLKTPPSLKISRAAWQLRELAALGLLAPADPGRARAVDVGGAPGSWSWCLAEELGVGVGINPIVTLEKKLLNMTVNLV
jgi:23S rRNA U2552 (ribose-2'-O)-methylase RlmE/FtsJ